MISKFLKESTKEIHKSTEIFVNADRIFSNDYSLSEYKELLQHLFLSFQIVEEALYRNIDLDIEKILSIYYESKRQFFLKDFDNIGINIVNPLKLIHLNSFYEKIGALYIIKGSSLGSNVIYKKLLDVSVNWEIKSFEFYNSEKNSLESWKLFLDYLDGLTCNHSQKNELVQGAKSAFLVFQTTHR